MAYDDFIISLLNLNRKNIKELDVTDVKGILEVKVTLNDKHPACPFCGGSTKIKEYKTRTYSNLPIAGKPSVILWKRRRYICKDCTKTFSEENPFGPENLHTTYSLLDGIAKDLKNIHCTYFDIAKKYHVSSNTISLYADCFIRVPRLRLPENLGIDEIHSKMAKYGGAYLCVMVDNNYRSLYEILPNRSKSTLAKFFEKIPKEERLRVKYVTIDMWEPYKAITTKYLPNAEIAVDPFHVVKHLCEGFTRLRIAIQNQSIYGSPTYYLLKKWHKLLDTDYHLDNEPKYNSFFKQKLNYRDIYNMLLDLNPDLTLAYELKEAYRRFNKEAMESDCKEGLDYLISIFKKSNLACYKEFIITVENWKQEILNSFNRPYDNRKQSNALAENINERLRELIQVSNGYSNFERFRARSIYCLNDRVFFVLCDHTPSLKTTNKNPKINKNNTNQKK